MQAASSLSRALDCFLLPVALVLAAAELCNSFLSILTAANKAASALAMSKERD